MSLDPAVRSRIESLLAEHPVVLFMKGTRFAPRCGFSAAAAGVLNELLPEYHSIDVLEDPDIREGIKAYGNWPTIPQLYVKGELVGGADIVQSMYTSGELQSLFGLPAPDRTPPAITISAPAAAAIRDALADAEPGLVLHMAIDARYEAGFHLAEADPRTIVADAGGIPIHMDLGTAQRARGVHIDWVETVQGAGLSIRNPNAPPAVKSLTPAELKARLDAGNITLVDVRPPEERAQAAVSGPFRTLDEGAQAFGTLPKDTPLAFLCHGGGRSARAAEHFRNLGFREVYNVEGGIDAWSREVDPGVPRY
ncbi:MAG TPA: Grx4 family monothiol glutaredoxin [Rudaea sp.]|nr:Grx4 family monothiol glutaredoxin [Rudaea sp.]